MMEHCPRCAATLPEIDGHGSPFCANCGLPQLRVAGDTLEAATATRTPGTPGPVSQGGVEWGVALRLLLFAMLIGLLPSLLKPDIVVVGGGGLLTCLLLPLLTLGAGAAYLRRRPYPVFTVGMGVRLGVVLALLLSAALAMLSGVAGFVLRYGMHSRMVQGSLDVAFQQFADRMSNAGTPLSGQWRAALNWPEVRAGAFVLTHVMTGAILLVVGVLAGALAGALIGGQQRRSRQ